MVDYARVLGIYICTGCSLVQKHFLSTFRVPRRIFAAGVTIMKEYLCSHEKIRYLYALKKRFLQVWELCEPRERKQPHLCVQWKHPWRHLIWVEFSGCAIARWEIIGKVIRGSEDVKSQAQADFCGGPVVKKAPCSAGDPGSVPGPGKSQMLGSN